MRATCTNISVIICAYTLDRWDDLVAAVDSVRRQTVRPHELVLVIDHNDELLARARADFPADVTVIPSAQTRGLSGARNTGLAHVTGDIVAFLDDDAVASDTWLAELCEGYSAENVLGVGGHIAPLWVSESGRPGWFPEEFDWVLGCTYRGMAEGTAVRNLIGANMSMRKDVLDRIGGFSQQLGRTAKMALGDEETGACIRATQLFPGGVFLHTQHALVEHRVPPSRTTWSYFFHRNYAEGISKAHLSRQVGTEHGLSAERTHAFVTLPRGAARALGAWVRGDRHGFARAFALLSGLACAGWGYVVGSLTPMPHAEDTAGASAVGPAAGRPRVLMVTPRFFPLVGGVEHHVAQVSRLLARDVNVTILTTDRAGQLPREDEVGGVRVLRVPAWPRERDYYVAPAIGRVIREGDWDLVHLQSVHTAVAPLTMWAARRAGIPYVVSFHGGGHSSAVRESMRGLQWRILRPLLARARKLIAVAEFEAERFSAALGLPRERFTVIPNGSDLPPIPAEQAARLRAEAGNLIVSVGRLERYKGHHRAIEALPAIVAEVPDARLRILGSGPYEAELRELAARLGVADRVEIGAIAPEKRNQMAAALASAALVVLLSDFETHPLAVIEALALGRPALVTDTSGLRELAERGLARAVPLDITTDALAATIAEELRLPRAVPEIAPPTWQQCADGLLGVYREVLATDADALPSAAVAVQRD